MPTEIRKWFEGMLAWLPGRAGNALRRQWYGRRFAHSEKIYIAEGCAFLSPETMHFETGVGVGRNSFFTAEGGAIRVGPHTAFNVNVHINASVGGEIRIGAGCLIAPNVVMRTAGHRYEDPLRRIREQGHSVGDIVIGDDVWIGANAVILGGTTIGGGAVIGAGAVVTKDIPPLSVAVGVPARVIRQRGGAKA